MTAVFVDIVLFLILTFVIVDEIRLCDRFTLALSDPLRDCASSGGRAAKPNVADNEAGLVTWCGGVEAGERKLRIFDDRMLRLAIERLTTTTSP